MDGHCPERGADLLLTLSQSLTTKGPAGEPLPTVWESLEHRGTSFRRGQLALVCAAPGIGKSAFALTLELKSGVTSMYFSADSDAFTQAVRAISIQTGKPLSESVEVVNNGEAAPELSNDLVRHDYSPAPTLKHIKTQLEAFEEVYGHFPSLVIIDNITNVRASADDVEDPFEGLESLMDWLHGVARLTSACVVGLHHVTGEYNDGDRSIPLSGVKGQIARVPEMVLTLHKASAGFGPDELRVSTVKNRGGKADPTGVSYTSLEFHQDSMQIKDR